MTDWLNDLMAESLLSATTATKTCAPQTKQYQIRSIHYSTKTPRTNQHPPLCCTTPPPQGSLTELTGPGWHVVATRGGGEWSFSVAHKDGQLLDLKVRKANLRFVLVRPS